MKCLFLRTFLMSNVVLALLTGCSHSLPQTQQTQQTQQASATTLSQPNASTPQCPTSPPRPEKPSQLKRFLLGEANDSCPILQQGRGTLLLMGGGPDVDDAFKLRLAPQIQQGNIVVLRARGGAGYNQYLQELTGAASVETLIVDSREKANSDYVWHAISHAEAVFIAGGDQSAYLNFWQQTRLATALQQLYQRGGVLGGTSAGLHVLGQYIYDPQAQEGAISREVVKNICHPSLQISQDFLQLPVLRNTLTDSHVKQRDRLGRSALFQAILGIKGQVIAVSEQTSLFIDADGRAVVDGAHEVYLLKADQHTKYGPAQCGQPFQVEQLLRYRLAAGDYVHFSTGQSNVAPIRMSVNGAESSFYQPVRPY